MSLVSDEDGQEPSTHRLPTFSAAEALRDGESGNLRPISLALDNIDALLQGGDIDQASPNGLPRGVVTEVYGPPGVGKTTLCMQAAAAALYTGCRVVWIDTATPLSGKRFEDILSSQKKTSDSKDQEESTTSIAFQEPLSRFSHYVAPTLAHLLALVAHAPPKFPPHDTALLVIDSLSTSIDNAYPRHAENRIASNKSDLARWLSDRRPAVISEIGSKLARMAATRNIAIMVTNNTVTKVRVGEEALLRPSLSGQEWDNAVGTRLVLFRDWPTQVAKNNRTQAANAARFAELVKPSTDAHRQVGRKVVAFQISESGIAETAEVAAPAQISPMKQSTAAMSKKRQHEQIADSDEDASSSEYGWNDSDDQLATEGLVDASFV